MWLHSKRYFTFHVATDLATLGVDDLTDTHRHTHRADTVQQACTCESTAAENYNVITNESICVDQSCCLQVHDWLNDHIVDLGVTVDPTLDYSVHINQLVAKAKSCIGLSLRCFITRNIDVLRKAFIMYIRPIVEYASSIWSHTHSGLIDKLESVQRHFKRIPALHDFSYCDRLVALNLASLELRRLRAHLNVLYEIIFAMCDNDSNSLVPWAQPRLKSWGDQGLGPNTGANAPRRPEIAPSHCESPEDHPRTMFENSDAKSCILVTTMLLVGSLGGV